MALRLVEVVHSLEDQGSLDAILGDAGVIDRWHVTAGDRRVERILIDIGSVEALSDAIAARFPRGQWRLSVMPVESTFPRAEEKKGAKRLARDELVHDIDAGLNVDGTFMLLAGLSALVAAVGLIKDSTAVVIAAMVLAPLLGPNMGLALATTLGDGTMARRAVKAAVVGLGSATVLALIAGWWLRPDPAVPEIAARTRVDLGDLVLAVASGVAGALSFTTALSGTLIGVMVAVAMMPPLVVMGMMLGAGHFDKAYGAFLLLAVNLIAVNLSGVATFLAQGIAPGQWWKKSKSRRRAWKALAAWAVLLAVLAYLVTRSGVKLGWP